MILAATMIPHVAYTLSCRWNYWEARVHAFINQKPSEDLDYAGCPYNRYLLGYFAHPANVYRRVPAASIFNPEGSKCHLPRSSGPRSMKRPHWPPTHSLLPIVQAFTKGTGVEVVTRRHLVSPAGSSPTSPTSLTEDQKIPDFLLSELGELTQDSRSQHRQAAQHQRVHSAVAGAPSRNCRTRGFDIPDYPEDPQDRRRKGVSRRRFAKVLGSAVNPVLREGNADRRAAVAVKKFAQKHPHKMMKDWPAEGSKARVAHMSREGFLRQRKVHHHGQGRRRPDRIRRGRRNADDRPEGEGVAPGR